MKYFYCVVALYFLAVCSMYSKSEVEAELSGVSSLIWRGTIGTLSPTITPSITYKNSSFNATLWGANDVTATYREFDIILSYQIQHLRFSLYDYYLPSNTEKNTFLYYKSDKDLRHDVEFIIDYTLSKKYPLNILVGTTFKGDFVHTEDSTCTEQYSTYIEVSYSIKTDLCDYKGSIGTTPYKGMYAHQAQIVNLVFQASNKVKFEKFYLPWKIQMIYSAVSEDLFFVGGIGIQLIK